MISDFRTSRANSSASNSPLLESTAAPTPFHVSPEDCRRLSGGTGGALWKRCDVDDYPFHKSGRVGSKAALNKDDDLSDTDTTRLPWDVQSESLGEHTLTSSGMIIQQRSPLNSPKYAPPELTSADPPLIMRVRRSSMASEIPDSARTSPLKRQLQRPQKTTSSRHIDLFGTNITSIDSSRSPHYEEDSSPYVTQTNRGFSQVNFVASKATSSQNLTRLATEKSGNLAWHELKPVACDFGQVFWSSLIANLNPNSEDWSLQTESLSLVRRLALHHPTAYGTSYSARKSVATSVGPVILAKVVQLADSLRSVVARNAMLTINDLFLFSPREVESATVVEAVALCLRKAAGPGGQFLMEEAERSWRQAVLVADHLRIFSYLSNALSKVTKSNAVMKAKCINATAFLLLRLTANMLRSITEHKDFGNGLLRVIFKATGDANQECRCAAARCLIVIFNLIPDLLQRFRQCLIDIDINQITSRIRRTPAFDVRGLYGISQLDESYKTLPRSAYADRAQLNLQIMLDNVDSIAKNPMQLHSSNPTPAPAGTSRPSVRTHGQVYRVETPIRRDAVLNSPRANSAIPGSMHRPSIAGVRLANPVCARPTTPVKSRDQYTQSVQRHQMRQTPTTAASVIPDMFTDSAWGKMEARGLDPNVSEWLHEEEVIEDTPWTNQTSRYPSRTPGRRETTARTPLRSRTPNDLATQRGRTGAVTPTLMSQQGRASTRPRTYGGSEQQGTNNMMRVTEVRTGQRRMMMDKNQ